MLRIVACLILIAGTALSPLATVFAQSYPNESIRDIGFKPR